MKIEKQNIKISKKTIKVFIGIIVACLIIATSFKAYDYIQRKIILEKARTTARIFHFDFESDIGYMPIKDKKSLQNLNYCINLLNNAYKNNFIYSPTIPYYTEYLCKQYRDKNLDYIIYLENNPNSKYGVKYIFTTQDPKQNLTKKLNLEIDVK